MLLTRKAGSEAAPQSRLSRGLAGALAKMRRTQSRVRHDN